MEKVNSTSILLQEPFARGRASAFPQEDMNNLSSLPLAPSALGHVLAVLSVVAQEAVGCFLTGRFLPDGRQKTITEDQVFFFF